MNHPNKRKRDDVIREHLLGGEDYKNHPPNHAVAQTHIVINATGGNQVVPPRSDTGAGTSYPTYPPLQGTAVPIQDLPEGDNAAVFGELTPQNKFWVLVSLGFVPKKAGKWYNPVFGIDYEWNWLSFNIETDNIKDIVTMIFRTGRVEGHRDIRKEIKKALDI